jgi:hypothetical protein
MLQISQEKIEGWRRGPESNQQTKALQTFPWPLGFRAILK